MIVIGAGIAGAATAWHLNRAGLHVVVLESGEICSGGSHAAGAFLSPKISKPSPYATYLNRALGYTLDFYRRYFPDLLHADGLLKLPLDAEDAVRCRSYEPYIDFPWQKREEGYFFPEAGIVETEPLCRALLQDIPLYTHTPARTIRREASEWIVDDTYRARYLVLATGSEADLLPLPYLRRKKIGGYRYDIWFEGAEALAYNIHRDISVSTALHHPDRIVVGASHIRNADDLASQAQLDSAGLLARAEAIVPMPGRTVLARYHGYRSYSFDYFPIVGPAVDASATLERFPYLRSGARVPAERFDYYPDLYLHTALGSRGFVFAPYNAACITQAILSGAAIEDRLLPAARFLKWARKG